jgi:hypothetical protein
MIKTNKFRNNPIKTERDKVKKLISFSFGEFISIKNIKPIKTGALKNIFLSDFKNLLFAPLRVEKCLCIISNTLIFDFILSINLD